MKKSFLKSPVNSIIFIVLNFVISTTFVVLVLASLYKHGEYRLDFTWMISFSIVFFGLVFNVLFLHIGLFSRVIITDIDIVTRKIVNVDNRMKWKSVRDVNVTKEMKQLVKTVEKPVIMIEGYDEVTKEDIIITMDYRDEVYDLVIDCINSDKEKTLEKMSKYFE